MTDRQSGEASTNRSGMFVRVVGPSDGETLGPVSAVRDRFMINEKDSGGGFSLVEHLVPPRALAAPLHSHSREDEYSFVLEADPPARILEIIAPGEMSNEPDRSSSGTG